MHPLLRHSGALLGAAIGLPLLGVGALVRPSWRPGLGERLGVGGAREPGRVWVHAASVGEVFAAARLFSPLEERGFPVCASATTPTGRVALRRGHATRIPRFAPLDHPWCTAAALKRAAPRALVLVETEVWPSWIAAAQRAAVPVVMVSARISERSLPRYLRLSSLLRGTWLRLHAVGARSSADAERFHMLGVPRERIRVTGDLKTDRPSPPAALDDGIAAFLGEQPIWAAVSTHPGEEAAVLDAHRDAKARGYRGGLVLAPRHLDRIADVEATLRAVGVSYRRRSSLPVAERLEAGGVLLLDTLGEVPALLPRSSLVFVGGTLAPVGGHNVLEPAWAGRAAVFGPHLDNVAEVADALLEAGGAQRVEDAAALSRAVAAALGDSEGLARRGEIARTWVSKRPGATDRSVALIEEAIGTSRRGEKGHAA